MILQEINEPILNMAVSKAATLLGAQDVNIVDTLVWREDYNGRIFSCMSDAIFVSTSTHTCVQRFASQSSVPVMCMRSRTHASIQALATVMAVIEQYGTMKNLTLSYVGPPHPVLNSYLLLSPMLGAHIKFKCCCDKCPVSPLLYKLSEAMAAERCTKTEQCGTKESALYCANVIIAGPSTMKKDKLEHFRISVEDMCCVCNDWIFFHTCPRGNEVNDALFYHNQARTFEAFENMHYIAASLMASAIKDYKF